MSGAQQPREERESAWWTDAIGAAALTLGTMVVGCVAALVWLAFRVPV